MNRGDNSRPWATGWRAARRNAVPGLVLNGAAVLLLWAYGHCPAVARACGVWADWQTAHGLAAAFAGRAFFNAVLPGVFLGLWPALRDGAEARAAGTWLALGANMVYWGGMGVVGALLYRGLSATVGADASWPVRVKKVLIDQFLYTPFFAAPMHAAFHFWETLGFSVSGLAAAWPERWVRRLVLPTLLTNWMLWIPAMTVVYAFPEPLQVQIPGLIGCFWALLCMSIATNIWRGTRHVRPHPAEAGATNGGGAG
jgi:hypothetical protein